MSLIDVYAVSYSILHKSIAPDGAGGYHTEFTPSRSVRLAKSPISLGQMDSAGKDRAKETFKFIGPRDMHISYGDILRDPETGTMYKAVTNSDSDKTSCAGLYLAAFIGEKWEGEQDDD